MMGHRQVEQAGSFYEFSLERHIPTDHLLRGMVSHAALLARGWGIAAVCGVESP
jgi:hypothetical protein